MTNPSRHPHQGTILSQPRWNDPTSDNLKLDIMRRAWGYTPPDWLTYDVTGALLGEILTNAEEIEKLFFPVRPPPHGSIFWSRGDMNREGHADGYAWLTVKEPQKLCMFLTIDGVEYRLQAYGSHRVKGVHIPKVFGIDGVTAASVDFEDIWGPRRAARVYREGAVRIQTHTVISTLPAPPRR